MNDAPEDGPGLDPEEAAAVRKLLTALADADLLADLSPVDAARRAADRIAGLEERLEAAEATIERLDAVVKHGAGSKLSKHQAIIDAAYQRATGTGGVRLTTGEVAIAARCSDTHARTLMAELDAALQWARLRQPDGPSDPKTLLVKTGDRDRETAREALLAAHERGELEGSA